MIRRSPFVTLAIFALSAVAPFAPFAPFAHAANQVTSAAAAPCMAASQATVPTVIELYTSEGCNSCPPADQWLSQTVAHTRGVNDKKDSNVIALAFHVDYWDYIGWKDGFAQPAFSQRQSMLARSGGASGVYTPQVFINGRDDRNWARGGGSGATAPAALPASAKFNVTSEWQGESVALRGKLAEANATIRLRYAITENGLVTVVKAGENKGETLRHDAVVRAHGTVTADASGVFAATVRVPRSMRRSTSQLHVIAEDARGNAVASATLTCAL